MQAAYEILSDQQEKAWYDSHRDAILRNDTGDENVQYEHNVPVTTTEDITRMYMSFNGRFEYTDTPSGFYTIIRDLFDRLTREEEFAAQWEGVDSPDFPSFGSSQDSYEDTVKTFYDVWNGFSTQKSFSWKNIYRYSEAPDRRTRRVMEKENKRLRDDAIREFNDAVRALVAYIRKRDPRYIPNTMSHEERQKMLREMASAQAARSRAANMARLNDEAVPDWAKSQVPEDELIEASEFEDVEEEHFECVICDKTFKSEKQYESHEKSKKHVKAVQQLRREMLKENRDLGLTDDRALGEEKNIDTGDTLVGKTSVVDLGRIDHKNNSHQPGSGIEVASDVGVEPAESQLLSAVGSNYTLDKSSNHLEQGTQLAESNSDDESEEDYTTRETIEIRVLSSGSDTSSKDVDDLMKGFETQSLKPTPKPKLGKAKGRRAKKALAQETTEFDAPGKDYECAACQARFPSKTRLFNHIKDLGHARQIPISNSTDGKKKSK